MDADKPVFESKLQDVMTMFSGLIQFNKIVRSMTALSCIASIKIVKTEEVSPFLADRLCETGGI